MNNKDKGSRDLLRKLLKGVTDNLAASAVELSKLMESDEDAGHSISYRYVDAYLGQAVSAVELARIVMRKRPKRTSTPKIDAAPLSSAEPQKAPIDSSGAYGPSLT